MTKIEKEWNTKEKELAIDIALKCIHKSNLHANALDYYKKQNELISKIDFLLPLAFVLPWLIVLWFSAEFFFRFNNHSESMKQHLRSKENFGNLAIQIMSAMRCCENYQQSIQKIQYYYDLFSTQSPDIPNLVIKEFINKQYASLQL